MYKNIFKTGSADIQGEERCEKQDLFGRLVTQNLELVAESQHKRPDRGLALPQRSARCWGSPKTQRQPSWRELSQNWVQVPGNGCPNTRAFTGLGQGSERWRGEMRSRQESSASPCAPAGASRAQCHVVLMLSTLGSVGLHSTAPTPGSHRPHGTAACWEACRTDRLVVL